MDGDEEAGVVDAEAAELQCNCLLLLPLYVAVWFVF